jgi:hypothetical protein
MRSSRVCNLSQTNRNRMSWVRHLARVRDMRNVHNILVGNLKGKDHLANGGRGGRIKFIWSVWVWNSHLPQNRAYYVRYSEYVWLSCSVKEEDIF